jgi:two-component system, chemotaxis family, protein-glutamate methylesterase/glutaminase
VTGRRGAPVRVVVVGTSLGGMHALETILGGLAADFALPIAIVQHRGVELDPHSQLTRMLQMHCALPVFEANDKMPMTGGRIYLAPADYHLLVDEGRFALSIDERVRYARPAIDVLFESAADSYRESVLGVVLTGASVDGAHGAACIKRRGGSVIAQDPATAESPVMPQAAITAGAVDRVLPLGEIAAFLNLAAETTR